MLSQERHREIAAGTALAPQDRLWRMLLGLASLPYGFVVGLRDLSFEFGIRPVRKAGVPVISIGNLTTGGTGKTPVVAMVCELLRELQLRPGIISRGYGVAVGQPNDEKLLLEMVLPDVPHVQHRKRIIAARQIMKSSSRPVPEALVMDDGFQHRQLHRDLDLVLVDATNPFGYGRLLPRGLLREPVGALTRADAVLLTRANLVSSQQHEALIRQINEAARRQIPVFQVSFLPTQLLGVFGQIRDIALREHQTVTAFCGIGAPENFFETIRRMGLRLESPQTLIFPDHHQYTPADLEAIREHARSERSQAIMMTLKDLVKIQPLLADWPQDDPFATRLWAVEIAAVMKTAEQEELKALMKKGLGLGRNEASKT